MKVFLSWSGEPSKAVAQALRDWLPDVIQNLRPWMSQRDLGAGVRWSAEIEGELRASAFGVICVTANNRHAPWLNFEAGAISNNLEGSRVVPYIFDMGFADIEGPLTQFQGKEATKEGTRELIHALNTVAGEQGLEATRLQTAFERMWPDLQEKLQAIPKSEGATEQPQAQQRTADDKLDEALLLLRNMSVFNTERTQTRRKPGYDFLNMSDIDDNLHKIREERLLRIIKDTVGDIAIGFRLLLDAGVVEIIPVSDRGLSEELRRKLTDKITLEYPSFTVIFIS
ncbi:toll/interleukin-1 receptor domain-containing protein [Deinococcus humi]|uniref:TIR domain-containing protein n=1 Tax=Deinococcus humi TaxID=662880 RepID=A0A7W8JRV2_9DEIO|nr:toll/interleukin-1 receptor domain-containing protein [Deinococcus humi]MBB5362067.1 hypothetical protein [Deinococcus humi]GGO22239.1 hypothetical protein GCM10008949_09280 [Deinococcus humi]